MKHSLAIAYAMKKRKKMADGGQASKTPPPKPAPSPAPTSDFAAAFKKGSGFARGGSIHKSDMEIDRPHDKKEKSWAGESTAGAMLRNSDINHGSKEKALEEHLKVLGSMKSMPSPKLKGMAEGGHVSEMKSGYEDHEGNDVKHNSMAMDEDDKDLNQHHVDMKASTSMHEEDIVDRIMNKLSANYSGLDRLAHGGAVMGDSYEDCEDDMVDRIMHKKHAPMDDFSDLDRYSEGGKVANQEHGHNNNELAGFSPNEFDDLVLRDDLESSYGDDDNSGDNLGNEQEDKDRADIISRIMKSRAKKDRMPRPA